MNAPVSLPSVMPKPPKVDAYAKSRSQCIDAFAQLEFAIITACNTFAIKLADRALIGQRLKKLRECERFKGGDMQEFCDRAERFMLERSDLVHSQMIVASTDTDTMAIFRNSADLSYGRPESRVYSLGSMRKLAADVSTLATQLERAVAVHKQPPPQ